MDLKDYDDGKDKGQMGVMKIGSPEDLSNAVYEMVHHCINLHGKRDGMTSCEIAGSAAMGALLNLALMVCRKPEGLGDGDMVPKEKVHLVMNSLRTETIMFASLLAAHQFGDVREHDAKHMALSCNFGAFLFGRALAQWQKLYPDLNIEDYLEEAVVDIARKALNNPENHNFNVEKEFNRAFMLKNNGSIN